MRLSRAFPPTIRSVPAEAALPSHKLMLRAGMIRQSAAGIYVWLPLGVRVLHKIAAIIRAEHDRIGAQEILMPTIQTAELWRRSGRYEDYGAEMLRILDRNDRELLYGPTNEEAITDIVAKECHSYRQLPLLLYQIQWKFRDEIRPRFGVMRGREFLMKDAYSFDLDREGALAAYRLMYQAYRRIFARLGLTVVPARASSGPIGGDVSHEFVALTAEGETTVAFHRGLLEADGGGDFDRFYAAIDDARDAGVEAALGSDLVVRKGIEVGHIFYFGDKYAKPLGAKVVDKGGESTVLQMGSYGIGVSRLAAAIIEAHHDEAGIRWPESVAPWACAILNLAPEEPAAVAIADDLYDRLAASGVEVVYDDRTERAGVKFSDADLIGVPRQIIVGRRSIETRQIEEKTRQTGERRVIALEHFLSAI